MEVDNIITRRAIEFKRLFYNITYGSLVWALLLLLRCKLLPTRNYVMRMNRRRSIALL